MTFAQAEKERHQRIIQLALLGTGDIVGLDAFVCDLPTYMNSARCTAPCDLFYILKHNFVRLQKRHGTQGLTERLRDMVRLSIQAYPNRIAHLPLYTVLMKKQLATVDEDEQQQYHAKHSWLLHVNHQKKSVRIIQRNLLFSTNLIRIHADRPQDPLVHQESLVNLQLSFEQRQYDQQC